MKKLPIIFIVLLFALPGLGATIIKNPYELGGGNWHMGNPHSHSDNSDGTASPAQLKKAYDDIGYKWLISSDHWGNSPSYSSGDDGWTADPGDVCGSGGDVACTVLWIAGAEHGWGEGHFVIAGGSRVTPSDTTTLNAEIIEARDSALDGTVDAVIILAHPVSSTTAYAHGYWTNVNVSGGKSYVPASAIEIANSYSATDQDPVDLLAGYIGGATASYSQQINAAFRHWDGWRELWAVGGDDTHAVTEQARYPTKAYGGFATVVQSASATINSSDLNAAIDQGNMYVRENKWISGTHSTGPAIQSVTVLSGTITVTYAAAVDVVWYKCGLQAIKSETGVTSTTYTPSGTERYVFVQATDASNLRTYTQPFFIMNNVNIASGATVTVSAGSTAANITDDSVETTWDSGAAPDATTWFKIDLGAPKLINGVQIVFGTADKYNYQIEVSEDDSTYYTFRHRTYRNDYNTTLNVGDSYGRYIKVTVPTYSVAGASGNVIVKEARVYAAQTETIAKYLNYTSGSDAANGSLATPYKTYANAAKYTLPRDKLIVMDSTVSTAIADTAAYHGRHPYAKRTISGMYGTKQIVKQIEVRTNNIDVEDFRIEGEINYPLYINGVTGLAQGMSADNVTVRRTLISGSTTATRLVFLYGSSGNSISNFRMENVLAYNVNTTNSVTGIYALNPKGPLLFYHNTLYLDDTDGTAGNAVYISASGISLSITAQNNIFWTDNATDATSNATVGTNNISYNCYGLTGAVGGSWGDTSATLQSDPLFADLANRNYRLTAVSALVDAGTDLCATLVNATDMAGNSVCTSSSFTGKGAVPDIGAYEYQQTAGIPAGLLMCQ